MKNLITALVLGCSITSSFAFNDETKVASSMVSTVASPFVSTVNPIAGALVSSTSIYWIVDVFERMPRYEGLDNDAIEVLAGSIELEDSLSLTMFKEDLHNNKEVLEAKFQANDINLTVEELTAEEIAQLALSSTVQE